MSNPANLIWWTLLHMKQETTRNILPRAAMITAGRIASSKLDLVRIKVSTRRNLSRARRTLKAAIRGNTHPLPWQPRRKQYF